MKAQSNLLSYRRWQHYWAVILVVSTFLLIGVGGAVTSTEAGMAVPDWPTTFEHNMFTVPWYKWSPTTELPAFLEHSHRLKGSWVGFVTLTLAIWIVATQWQRRWLRNIAIASLVLVIVQGLMGGFRVTENSRFLAFVHGVTGQLFFCFAILMAAATGKWWLNRVTQMKKAAVEPTASTPSSASSDKEERRANPISLGLRWMTLGFIGLLVVQLILGAAVRHSQSALSIPDFPLAYGQLVPPMTQGEIIAAIDALPVELASRYYEPEQVAIHFYHRIGAVVVSLAAFIMFGWILTKVREVAVLVPTLTLFTLLVLQVMLGASVVWSKEDPQFATMHQATGALLLGTAAWLAIRVWVCGLYTVRIDEARPEVPASSDQVVPTASETEHEVTPMDVVESNTQKQPEREEQYV